MEISIDVCLEPARVARALLAAFALLLLAHFAGLYLTFALHYGDPYGLIRMFNLALERNVPTLFECCLFLLASALFLLLARLPARDPKERRLWLVLAATFLFLAADEGLAIHERLIGPVRTHLHTSGLLFFAWVVPYLVAVLALAMWATPKFWRLGNRFRILFGLSAVVFLSGAVGMEMLGGQYYQANHETVDLTYRLYQTMEETLEAMGLILLVYTQLALIRTRATEASFRLSFGLEDRLPSAQVP
ncbi:hypothetical protein LVB87_08800 [Lysobacter sp. KIS68-7]|uniref:hypothetical protein n=1 Tax=Lysobacter sp. KIS68-7 TaxID=2904252 RepID=UPI001E30A126|nr:hypothetical protein [Lysobacter sp. KIS68-7]UHQ18324.1 hypothetical protein LVB87_08800 [Lysobacter sp. KIS68-7]